MSTPNPTSFSLNLSTSPLLLPSTLPLNQEFFFQNSDKVKGQCFLFFLLVQISLLPYLGSANLLNTLPDSYSLLCPLGFHILPKLHLKQIHLFFPDKQNDVVVINTDCVSSNLGSVIWGNLLNFFAKWGQKSSLIPSKEN